MWKNFENNCFVYISDKFKDNAIFEKIGDSNSNYSDIFAKCLIGTKKSFYIEVKEPSAQCGQFVLLPDLLKRQFRYSPNNKSNINEYSEKIIEIMNKDFDSFANAGTKGKKIEFQDCEQIFYAWILDYYKGKGVSFFITQSRRINSKYIIFRLQDFSKYFNVSASYRTKKSGSRSVPQRQRQDVLEILEHNYFIPNQNIQLDNNDIIFSFDGPINKNEFNIDNKRYLLSQIADNPNFYKVRELSDTKNQNVIFSISLKENVIEGLSEKQFIHLMSNL